MYLYLISFSVLINFITAVDHHVSKNGIENKALVDSSGRPKTARIQSSPSYHIWNEYFGSPHKGSPFNLTYHEKGENQVRVPAMGSEKIKKKALKKPPKRTIQKIIRSRKSKLKKLYVVRRPSSNPTVPPKSDFKEAEEKARKAEMTTRTNDKKIKKKYIKQTKLPRYPLPYRKKQVRKNNYIRPKRETRDIFILQDFDSMKFMKGKKDGDVDVVNAHFKKYW